MVVVWRTILPVEGLSLTSLRHTGGLLGSVVLGAVLLGCHALSGDSQPSRQSYGPNILTTQPSFWTDPTASATRDIDGRTYTLRISATGPKPSGVQQYWVVPPPNAGDKMRVQFEAQGTRGMELGIRFQRNRPPFDAFGLEKTVPLTIDWQRHEFEFTTNGTTDNCQLMFWCSSVPGTMSIRSVTLQRLDVSSAPIKSGGTAQPVKSLAELFAYYDEYVARFKARDVLAITSAWAPGYKDRFGDVMPSDSDDPEMSGRERLELQMSYSGRFTNGPSHVYATSLTEEGNTVKVIGYREGNYKYLTPDNKLQEGGASFSNTFTDTWTLKDGIWTLRKTIHDKYVEDSDSLIAAKKKAHDALKAKYGTKKSEKPGGLVAAFGKKRSAYEQILGRGREDTNVTEQTAYDYTWKGKDVRLTLFNANDHIDALTLYQAGETWQEAVRLLDLDPATLKAGKPVNGDTPIEGIPGAESALFIPGNGGTLMIDMPKPSSAAAAAPTSAVSGVFIGNLYIDGKPSTGTDFKSDAPRAVRLTLDKSGSYRFEQISNRMTVIEVDGGAILIARGKSTWKGNECHLAPDEPNERGLSVAGWSFNKPLTLKHEADGSLSLVGKPNGATDPLPQGQELRFRNQ